MLAAAGCSDAGSTSTAPRLGPHDEAAEVRPDVIVLEPATVAPGEPVEVRFPDERVRGVHYVLEAQRGAGWSLEYHLTSDWGEGRETSAVPASGADFAVVDVGIGGGGPDVISIPAVVAAGAYRVCTGNSRPNVCALLTVEPG